MLPESVYWFARVEIGGSLFAVLGSFYFISFCPICLLFNRVIAEFELPSFVDSFEFCRVLLLPCAILFLLFDCFYVVCFVFFRVVFCVMSSVEYCFDCIVLIIVAELNDSVVLSCLWLSRVLRFCCLWVRFQSFAKLTPPFAGFVFFSEFAVDCLSW